MVASQGIQIYLSWEIRHLPRDESGRNEILGDHRKYRNFHRILAYRVDLLPQKLLQCELEPRIDQFDQESVHERRGFLAVRESLGRISDEEQNLLHEIDAERYPRELEIFDSDCPEVYFRP